MVFLIGLVFAVQCLVMGVHVQCGTLGTSWCRVFIYFKMKVLMLKEMYCYQVGLYNYVEVEFIFERKTQGQAYLTKAELYLCLK